MTERGMFFANPGTDPYNMTITQWAILRGAAATALLIPFTYVVASLAGAR